MSWPILKVLIAVAVALLILRIGMKILGSFARPVPPPPDPGELRKVRLAYECSICGTTVKMTQANDQMPEPPRHCMEDMTLLTAAEDL